MSTTAETATEIRAFHVEIPEDKLDDLRRRFGSTAVTRAALLRSGEGISVPLLPD